MHGADYESTIVMIIIINIIINYFILYDILNNIIILSLYYEYTRIGRCRLFQKTVVLGFEKKN